MSTTESIALGARIRARRRELGLTQSDLAATLDTYTSRVHEWETGFRTVKADELPEIAAALNMEVDELKGEAAARAKRS